MTTAERVTRAKTDIDEVYEAGLSQAWSYVTGLNSVFNAAKFPTGFEITMNLQSFEKDLTYAFYNSTGLRKVTMIGNYPGGLTCTYVFRDCEVEEIDLANFVGSDGYIHPVGFKGAFQNARKLRIIHGVFDMEDLGDITSSLSATSGLEEIRLKPNTLSKPLSFASCGKLSDASIQSIIVGLADLTGQTSQTISFHTNVISRLTDAQALAITSKNWTI
jgi:hypothetical protein